MAKEQVVEQPVPASEVEPEPDPDAQWTASDKRLRGFQTIPLKKLRNAERNPRRGAVAEVIESLREFGQHRPMVVQASTGQVIVGNHLLMAARTLGWDTGDCYVVDDDDKKALRRAIADNAVGDKAGWDDDELGEVMREIGPVPGFDEADVEKIVAKITPEEVEKAEPTYPLVPRLNEKYDYVMIFCETETDWTWLETKFGLRQEKSYKSTAVAKSHVVTVSRLQEILGD